MSSTDPTALWTCHGLAMGFCVARIVLRVARRQRFMAGDYWTMAALLAIAFRAALNHVIIEVGTTTSKLFPTPI